MPSPTRRFGRRHPIGRRVIAAAAIEALERRALLSLAPAGGEFPVNTFTPSLQFAPAVASDGDGDVVVVWQSDGQDGAGYGIFGRRYNAAGAVQGGEFRVNTTTSLRQSAPAVARDADGDFVVAWESRVAGGHYDIFAQRFNPAGIAQGPEFRVNTFTTTDQRAPSVAADAGGGFVIAWESSGQEGPGNSGIYAQRYAALGHARGVEFHVNSTTTGTQSLPAAATDADGDFVIAWNGSGSGDALGVFAQRYGVDGVPRGGEFRANTLTLPEQLLPAVAMDAGGDFIVAWQSYGEDGAQEGVYAQRFNAAGGAQGTEFRANTVTASAQTEPAVAVDANGNFLITWSSFNQDGSGAGVYAQGYDAAGVAQGAEFRVNVSTTSNQRASAVAMDGDGDAVIAWHGPDASGYGVYARRYTESNPDTAAPVVAGVFVNGERVLPYAIALPALSQIVVSFSENMSVAGGPTGPSSVTNPANWLLTRNGVDISGDIGSITYGFNTTANRHEAVLNLATSHTSGNFLLVARDVIADQAGNALDGDLDGAPASSMQLPFSVAPNGLQNEFRVNTFTPDWQYGQAVAADQDGDFVVVWHSKNQEGASYEIYAQRYNAAGIAQGGEFRVNTFTSQTQQFPDVAMDADGDFVVAWSSFLQDGGATGVYAQRFNAAGARQGGEFRVNTHTTENQYAPAVAMNATGDFVITWGSDGQDGSDAGIYAQRYAAGVPQGGEFRVNTYTTNNQSFPAAAMDSDGDFVITWQSEGQDGSVLGVFARRYNALGAPQGPEFRVNSHTTNSQSAQSIAMRPDGGFVIVWQSDQDGSFTGCYGQRYDSAAVPQGGEFPVNTFTPGGQNFPVVGMDARGEFVVAWQSDGIVAQRFAETGLPQGGEFHVNANAGSNTNPAVAMDEDGEFVVAWTNAGQDGSYGGVYARQFIVRRTPIVGSLADAPDPIASGNLLTLTARNVTDDGTVTSVSFYRETNGVAGLQVGFQGDTHVGTDTTPTTGIWSVDVPTTGLAGPYTYWAQATDDAGLVGAPASTTNTVTPAAPAVINSSFNFATLPQRLSFTFNQNVGPSLDLSDITVQQLPAGPTVMPSAVSYDASTNTATFTFSSAIPDGRYRARLIAGGIGGPGGQLPADHTFEFTFLRGDANGDGAVNLTDFNVLAANFGQSPRDFTQGDFDYSGVVNLADFNLLASRFGVVLGPGGAVTRTEGGRLPGAPGRAVGTGGFVDESEDDEELVA